MKNITGNQLRGHLETMVLSALSQGPGHGFEIIRRLEGEGCGVLELKEGTLYPVLYRLEEAGLISGKWDDQKRKARGPRRRVYKIVQRGKRELVDRRKDWDQFVQVIGGIVGATA